MSDADSGGSIAHGGDSNESGAAAAAASGHDGGHNDGGDARGATRALDGHGLRKSAEADHESFWARQAAEGLEWFRPFDAALEWDHPFARWFVGGTTNACYNAVDRHQQARAGKPAIIWESEDGHQRRTVSYGDLFADVQRFANVLGSLGVRSGDRVTICLPMVPELAVAMLACARIGAVHTVIFSGFSAASVRGRVSDSGSQVVITADGGYRRGRIIELKGTIDEALSGLDSVRHVVVLRRTRHDVAMSRPRDKFWDDLMDAAPDTCPAVPLESSHPLFILYTSGTTGKPKGVLHGTGGYLTHVHSTFGWAFGAGDDDVYFCTADVGWVTGHSYVVYGPLMHGITSVMYEGAPDHPGPSRMWQLIRDHGVTIFYTTPTLLRMLMRFDSPEKDADRHGGPSGLDTLRLLGTVGEPINPEVWRWYHERVGQGRCPIIDTWWQTETGGMLISPLPAIEDAIPKPGSAARPVPGIEIGVLDDEGNPVPVGAKGQLVVRKPWPGMLMTLWGDDARYREAYWKRYPGLYHAGDYARVDEDGYVWLLGRADDVLKVAGHRIGTAELEGCAVSHDAVAESAVCGIHDEVKGESIVVFAVPRSGTPATDYDRIASEIVKKIRSEVGSIATPGAVYVVPRLPKTRSGKIMRRLLKSLAVGGEVGDTSTLEDADVIGEISRLLSSQKP